MRAGELDGQADLCIVYGQYHMHLEEPEHGDYARGVHVSISHSFDPHTGVASYLHLAGSIRAEGSELGRVNTIAI